MSGSWLSGAYPAMRWMSLIAVCAVSLTGCVPGPLIDTLQVAARQTRTLMTGPGMTADVEFLPPGPGEWHLDVSAPGADRPWTIPLPLRVQ